jgi:Flp pilus assembly protein protease CpaA
MGILWVSLIAYVLLLALTLYFDAKSYIIPNWMTLPAIALFLAFCIITHVEWPEILVRVLSTGGMFFIAGLATSLLLKKETIGGGDIKLITAVGLYKGWQDGMMIIFFSAFSALACVLALSALKKRKLDERIPFGFFIAICGIFVEAVSLFGKEV